MLESKSVILDFSSFFTERIQTWVKIAQLCIDIAEQDDGIFWQIHGNLFSADNSYAVYGR